MKSILVVDDSVANLKFVEGVLKDYYKLILVKSGKQALKYLEKNPADLVLLDLLMDEMDGFETFEKIRALKCNGEVPVMFLTADSDVESEIKGLEMGAVDFIKKPFVPEVMMNRIKNALALDEINKNLEAKVVDKTLQIEELSFKMKSIEEEARKSADEPDYLTGLLGRKSGEKKIIRAMKEKPGCLAFIDLDNLKRTNDTMGHLAGDYALMTVGEVLSTFGEDAVVSRLGGDEFIYYMIGADKDEATSTIEKIMEAFSRKKEKSTYLSVSSLSIGLCTTTTTDTFAEVLQKADKALYHVKQSGKCGYYFYANLTGVDNRKCSIDLERLITNLKKQGAYTGSLSVEYREFAKIYDFIRHLVERYEYRMQLIMITMETTDPDNFYIDKREQAMACMEKVIKASLRNVDVCTRFSSEQFLVILMNAGKEDISVITNRIFDNFYKVCKDESVVLGYDIAELKNDAKETGTE